MIQERKVEEVEEVVHVPRPCRVPQLPSKCEILDVMLLMYAYK
jgi:hypothetical protein